MKICMFEDEWYPVYGFYPPSFPFEWHGPKIEVSFEEWVTMQLQDNLRTQANEYLKTIYERKDSKENS